MTMTARNIEFDLFGYKSCLSIGSTIRNRVPFHSRFTSTSFSQSSNAIAIHPLLIGREKETHTQSENERVHKLCLATSRISD